MYCSPTFTHLQALSISIQRDNRGCLVLTRALAQARASCGPQGAQAFASSSVTRQVLGLCGLGLQNGNNGFPTIQFPPIQFGGGSGRKMKAAAGAA